MIRPATLDDLPRLLVLGERMHAESPRFSRLRFSATRLEATLREVLGSPYGFAMVAEREDRLIGGLIAGAGQHWCSEDLVASDLALFIEPEHRGGLAAARLVHRYRLWAREVGAVIREIGITTGIHTEQTAAFIEGLGMKRCGVILEE